MRLLFLDWLELHDARLGCWLHVRSLRLIQGNIEVQKTPCRLLVCRHSITSCFLAFYNTTCQSPGIAVVQLTGPRVMGQVDFEPQV